MKAIIYCRVSTDGQERDGTSLETQEQECRTYAESRGWTVVDSIRDTASGFSLERPGIERLRGLLRDERAAVVLAYAVDRLSRNQSQVGVLLDEAERYGVQLDFVTEDFEQTAVGKFILSARAFVAEVEREKIAERTTRGKTARARSGRIPQATGKGIYGYRYNRATGQREIDEFQAAVVRRVFERYAQTRSFSAVCNELNGLGITAFGGGRWYPLTIRNLLKNETYVGRTVFRKTKRVRIRNGTAHTKVVERPPEEWIEIEGATPPIVDHATWRRVQDILNDPERTRRKPVGQSYLLSSRAKCGICGSAMVGHTLTAKGKLYRYYRCRHKYDKNTGRECTSRYVSAEALEASVRDEVIRVLSDPQVVLSELARDEAKDHEAANAEAVRLEREIKSLESRQKRLIQLYTLAEVGDEFVRDEAAKLQRQKSLLEDQLLALRKPDVAPLTAEDAERLQTISTLIAEWLETATNDEWTLVFEALQLRIQATTGGVTISGVLPVEAPKFVTIERTSA